MAAAVEPDDAAVQAAVTRARALIEAQTHDVSAVQTLKERMLHIHDDADDPELQLDWDLYREVPATMEQEEALLLDYFRKLKFIYLELETKLRFLADLQDDPETGQEPQILSTADVTQREQECKRVKQQLVEAKKRVRDLRAEIDGTADALSAPWAAVERGTSEAHVLLSEITDMELELAKIKAAEGTHGALTTAEAEAVCDEQIVAMQTLDDETTRTMQEMEQAKRELNEALRALERLKAERSVAEKRANEAKLGMGRDSGRDWELERLCTKHAAMLETLQAALGITRLAAPTARDLHITLAPPAGEDGHRTLQLRFDEPGGALVDVQLLDAEQAPVALSESVERYCREAMHTNHAAALVQAVWCTYVA